jgi:PKD repeat protein
MINRVKSSLFMVTLYVVAMFFITVVGWAKEGYPHLAAGPLVLEKSPMAISDNVRSYLRQQGGETAIIWVFFTDKGVFSKNEFQAKASSVKLSEKVLKRRAKMGLDHVVFADLPVVQNYIDDIVNLGAQHRRTSRWLNAASFEISMDKLDEIGVLPFVSEIKPVARYKREEPPTDQLRIDVPQRKSLDGEPDTLNYGYALDQLNQINVPAVHQKGYHGEGVILAIFDTGFRKSHEAFAQHYLEGRVLAEYDFVFNDSNTANEPEDWSSAWDHGTYIWSTTGGEKDGVLYGPAFKASFILCKTEDVRSETPVEEDNWVAALEWVDSLAADVVTSSLCYSDWYTYEDLDGQTATITLAANTAAGLGIVVCNAMGNSGPAPGTLLAPADAFDILAVGAVNSSGTIASFSSRGSTYDGRTKPEVCARGVSTACATSSSDNSYGTASGTSLSTPLAAGAAVLMVQARPNFTPQLIRQALMETADHANNPNNDYGWGIISVDAALGWGANFYADVTLGQAPMNVQFYDSSSLSATSWVWSFGDGDSAFVQNPSHLYANPGAYDVSLTIGTEYGDITQEKSNYILMLADTLRFRSDSAFAGHQVVMSVDLVNSQELNRIIIPFTFETELFMEMSFDSVTLGMRTSYFERLQYLNFDPANKRYTVELVADVGGGSLPLASGSGEIMKMFFSIDSLAFGGRTNQVDTIQGTYALTLIADALSYEPTFYAGTLGTKSIIRGDANYSHSINITDITFLVTYLFRDGSAPVTVQSGDAAFDYNVNINDVTYLVAYLFQNGPPPPSP